MYTSVYIDFSIQTPEGPKRFARFELGNDRAVARDLFKKLKGSGYVNDRDMLFIEFMESVNGFPVNLDILTCDLQELGMNTMLITREIFRLSNLKV